LMHGANMKNFDLFRFFPNIWTLRILIN
jgi:hypothetical protein